VLLPPRLRLPRGLYGITPDWDDTERLLAAAHAAARGGMRTLQWRRKTALPADPHSTSPINPQARSEQARATVALCRDLGVCCLINDDWQLVLDTDADGVHLGRDDGDIAQVRQRLGPDKLIGASCYNDLARARAALAAGADYVAFGAIYTSPTKPQAVRAPLACLTEMRRLTDALPAPRPAVVAIGGITPANAAPVVQAGADAIALIDGLFNVHDVETAARRCTEAFDPES